MRKLICFFVGLAVLVIPQTVQADADIVIYLKEGNKAIPVKVRKYFKDNRVVHVYPQSGRPKFVSNDRVCAIVDRRRDYVHVMNRCVFTPSQLADIQRVRERQRRRREAISQAMEKERRALEATRKAEREGGYEIVQKEDLSYRKLDQHVVRLQYRIRVAKPMTEAELRVICEDIIQRQKKLKPHNAISFLFYLPGSDIRGLYTSGKADWAPDGIWEYAGDVRTGFYSRHRLAIKAGSALGEIPKSVVTSLSEDTRRQVFYDVVAAQDMGIRGKRGEVYVAKKYGLSVSTVSKIVIEGAMKQWPMPPQ